MYRDHFDAVREQLTREPYPTPRVWVDPALRTLDDVVARYREILERTRAHEAPGALLDGVARLVDYTYHPAIKAAMAV